MKRFKDLVVGDILYWTCIDKDTDGHFSVRKEVIYSLEKIDDVYDINNTGLYFNGDSDYKIDGIFIYSTSEEVLSKSIGKRINHLIDEYESDIESLERKIKSLMVGYSKYIK